MIVPNHFPVFFSYVSIRVAIHGFEDVVVIAAGRRCEIEVLKINERSVIISLKMVPPRWLERVKFVEPVDSEGFRHNIVGVVITVGIIGTQIPVAEHRDPILRGTEALVRRIVADSDIEVGIFVELFRGRSRHYSSRW